VQDSTASRNLAHESPVTRNLAHEMLQITGYGRFPRRVAGYKATPGVKVHDGIDEYLKSEQKVSIEGIAQVTEMMPIFAQDFVAYEDMKAYLIDEDADLQETNQDLELIELIGVQNWLVQKLNGTTTAE
jgi:bacterioferritin (cytochrome b1)